MRVCDKCKNINAPARIVKGKIESVPAFGARGTGIEFTSDLCDACLKGIVEALGADATIHALSTEPIVTAPQSPSASTTTTIP